jgi:hypothetical protein
MEKSEKNSGNTRAPKTSEKKKRKTSHPHRETRCGAMQDWQWDVKVTVVAFDFREMALSKQKATEQSWKRQQTRRRTPSQAQKAINGNRSKGEQQMDFPIRRSVANRIKIGLVSIFDVDVDNRLCGTLRMCRQQKWEKGSQAGTFTAASFHIRRKLKGGIERDKKKAATRSKKKHQQHFRWGNVKEQSVKRCVMRKTTQSIGDAPKKQEVLVIQTNNKSTEEVEEKVGGGRGENRNEHDSGQPQRNSHIPKRLEWRKEEKQRQDTHHSSLRSGRWDPPSGCHLNSRYGCVLLFCMWVLGICPPCPTTVSSRKLPCQSYLCFVLLLTETFSAYSSQLLERKNNVTIALSFIIATPFSHDFSRNKTQWTFRETNQRNKHTQTHSNMYSKTLQVKKRDPTNPAMTTKCQFLLFMCSPMAMPSTGLRALVLDAADHYPTGRFEKVG